MVKKNFNDIDFSGLKLASSKLSKSLQNTSESIYTSMETIQKKQEDNQRYKDDILQTLKGIEANTVGINEIVPLISNSIGKQDELLEFLKEALAISASETKEEAEHKWRKLLNKASQLTTDVETIQKLTGFTSTILRVYMENR